MDARGFVDVPVNGPENKVLDVDDVDPNVVIRGFIAKGIGCRVVSDFNVLLEVHLDAGMVLSEQLAKPLANAV